jgi:hypothetical protein
VAACTALLTLFNNKPNIINLLCVGGKIALFELKRVYEKSIITAHSPYNNPNGKRPNEGRQSYL